MNEKNKSLLGGIPQLGSLLERPEVREIRRKFGDGAVKITARELISETRNAILSGKRKKALDGDELISEIEKRVRRLVLPEGRKAINATGILLHTGLGRAPLCTDAVDSLSIFSGYSVLQADLESGKRSLREDKVEKMLIELTGCEAATVVNNNAAATMLVLNSVSEGKEAIISRGQLIEIGGQFRMPDVMEKSRAIIREIGTTNRTHIRDYEKAINESTGAIIHVHTSNYKIRGFTGTPGICELRRIADKHKGVALIDDLGSGALVPLSTYGLRDEPLVRDSISAGADLVCFSGDKLICGPQSGIICGRKEFVDRIRNNPFARMFRVCKLTLAALETTLMHFINNDFEKKLPFYVMLSKDLDALQAKAKKFASALKKNKSLDVNVSEDMAFVGSGSAPDEGIRSFSVRVKLKVSEGNGFLEKEAAGLRNSIPSVFCRIHEDSLVFDMRTLLDDDYDFLVKNLHGSFSDIMKWHGKL